MPAAPSRSATGPSSAAKRSIPPASRYSSGNPPMAACRHPQLLWVSIMRSRSVRNSSHPKCVAAISRPCSAARRATSAGSTGPKADTCTPVYPAAFTLANVSATSSAVSVWPRTV